MAEATSGNTSILEWAGQSLGGAVIGAVAGIAVQQALLALGITPDSTGPIMAALDRISAKLDVLTLAVGQIDRRVAELAGQLELSTLDTKAEIQLTQLNSAITVIETHHTGATGSPTGQRSTGSPAPARSRAAAGSPSYSSPIVSLAELINRQRGNTPVTRTLIEDFLDHLIVDWDIPTQVARINSALVGDVDPGGLLRLWTDFYVATMGRGKLDSSLLSYYERLEQRFVRAITAQLQGVHLVMLAKCYGSPVATIPPDAEAYLWGTLVDGELRGGFVKGMLEPEIDLFLWCAEKLALSQGQWRSPWLITEEKVKLDATGRREYFTGIGVPADLGTILFRSEYLGRRLTEIFRDVRDYKGADLDRSLGTPTPFMRSNGSYAHVIHRSPVSEALAGWSNAERRVLPSTSTPAVHFGNGPLVDGYIRLFRREVSELLVARYFRPASRYRYNDSEVASFTRGTLTRQGLSEMGITSETVPVYDVETGALRPGQTAEIHPMIYHRLDVSPLCASPDPDKRATGWTIGPVTGKDKYSSGTAEVHQLEHPIVAPDALNSYMRAYAALTGKQDFDSSGSTRGVGIRLEGPAFVYRNRPEMPPDTLTVHLNLMTHSSRTRSQYSTFHMGGRVTIALNTPQGEVALYDSDTANGGKVSLWSSDAADPAVQDEVWLTKTINVGTVGKFEVEKYGVIMTLGVFHTGYQPGSTCTIGVAIRDFSFSWV